MDLKELLFFRTKTEVEAWAMIDDKEEKELQLQRFMSVYQIIEEAGLENEYKVWKENNA